MKRKVSNLVTVVLRMPKDIATFLIYVRAIFAAMFANPLYAGSLPKINEMGDDIVTLQETETGFKSRPQTKSIEDRDLAFEKVKADLRTLRGKVQELADADPINATAIVAGALMFCKGQITHDKQKNTVKDGVNSGSVKLTAEGAGAHQWRMSLDGTTWTLLRSSTGAKTTVYGLNIGVNYYFQSCKILPKGEEGEWSQSIKIMVR